ncbi:universal stress protein [Chitinophagaceae bacterium 26-R-25]|nr:universal stress protein [Chitinophagaceae bacterium 26-R-25]
MKTILIGVDYSESSKNAALYGVKLAKSSQSMVILQHVYLLPTPVSEVPYLFTPFDDIQHENEKELQKEAERLSELVPGVEIQTIVSVGLPAATIIDTAEENNANLIVLGMKQYASGMEKLIGSTADEASRLSKIPVLAIPPGSSFEPVQTVTYATDFSYKLNPVGLETLKTILTDFNAKLQIVNIKKVEEEVSTVAYNQCVANFNKVFEGIDHNFYTHISNNVEDGLMKFLLENHSQMLVMVAHRHNFFARIFKIQHTKEMLHSTYIPLLILNDK